MYKLALFYFIFFGLLAMPKEVVLLHEEEITLPSYIKAKIRGRPKKSSLKSLAIRPSFNLPLNRRVNNGFVVRMGSQIVLYGVWNPKPTPRSKV